MIERQGLMIETLQEFNERVNKKMLVLEDTKLNE
jgi:hypothetical protein